MCVSNKDLKQLTLLDPETSLGSSFQSLMFLWEKKCIFNNSQSTISRGCNIRYIFINLRV